MEKVINNTSLQIKNKVQMYLEDLNQNGLKKLFAKEEHYRYVFRHSDCPIVFTTDGFNLFATDMDDLDYELFRDGNFNLHDYYNDISQFILQFLHIQKLLQRELQLSNWSCTHSITINEYAELVKLHNQ